MSGGLDHEQRRHPPNDERRNAEHERRPPDVATWLLTRAPARAACGRERARRSAREWRGARGTAAHQAWYCATPCRSRRATPGVASAPGAGDRPGEGDANVAGHLRQDLRYACRSYLRAPSVHLAILTTLALGIGASTAIFSMVNGILLRPLPLARRRPPSLSERTGPTSQISNHWPNFLEWRSRAHPFKDWRYRGRTSHAHGARQAGAGPRPADDGQFLSGRRGVRGSAAGRRRGRPPRRAPTVIVSHEFWQTHLGGEPERARVRRCGSTRARMRSSACCRPDSATARAYDLFVPMGPIVDDRFLNDRAPPGIQRGRAPPGRASGWMRPRGEMAAIGLGTAARTSRDQNTGVPCAPNRSPPAWWHKSVSHSSSAGAVGCLAARGVRQRSPIC